MELEMANDWLKMTACDLGRGIENGTISPIALTQTYLDAIAAHPMADRIYARTTNDRAIQEATLAEARAKSGKRLSLLDGVPISWKDLFDTKGTKTEAGSRLLTGRTPDADAVVLQNATNAGLVCLGKTHMSELAFSGLGLNPMTQTTPCVNDLDAVSGGSSSGAAGSVAFNLAAAGIGSDTGGSVRIPSAWNDLVGLKTTAGDLSLDGVVPLCPKFDTVGPLCRSVEDAAYLYAILRGDKPRDLTPFNSLRLMMLTSVALDDIETTPMASFNAACDAIRADGIEIVERPFPIIDDILGLAAIIFTTEAYAQWGEVLEVDGDKMFPEIYDRFMAGKKYSTDDYASAWAQVDLARKNWAEITAEFDAVILPSSPVMPPNLQNLISDSDYYRYANLLALRNTRIGNMLGQCAISLPTSTPSCGLMIMGAPNSEYNLLNIAAKIEQIL
jgi:aspartyl-tRNA(Asn)/glutamyl-tRNA(Gln) amidotransferase subunit A